MKLISYVNYYIIITIILISPLVSQPLHAFDREVGTVNIRKSHSPNWLETSKLKKFVNAESPKVFARSSGGGNISWSWRSEGTLLEAYRKAVDACEDDVKECEVWAVNNLKVPSVIDINDTSEFDGFSQYAGSPLNVSKNRAFAYSENNGYWAWVSNQDSIKSAAKGALERCLEEAETCKLWSLNGIVLDNADFIKTNKKTPFSDFFRALGRFKNKESLELASDHYPADEDLYKKYLNKDKSKAYVQSITTNEGYYHAGKIYAADPTIRYLELIYRPLVKCLSNHERCKVWALNDSYVGNLNLEIENDALTEEGFTNQQYTLVNSLRDDRGEANTEQFFEYLNNQSNHKLYCYIPANRYEGSGDNNYHYQQHIYFTASSVEKLLGKIDWAFEFGQYNIDLDSCGVLAWNNQMISYKKTEPSGFSTKRVPMSPDHIRGFLDSNYPEKFYFLPTGELNITGGHYKGSLGFYKRPIYGTQNCYHDSRCESTKLKAVDGEVYNKSYKAQNSVNRSYVSYKPQSPLTSSVIYPYVNYSKWDKNSTLIPIEDPSGTRSIIDKEGQFLLPYISTNVKKLHEPSSEIENAEFYYNGIGLVRIPLYESPIPHLMKFKYDDFKSIVHDTYILTEHKLRDINGNTHLELSRDKNQTFLAASDDSTKESSLHVGILAVRSTNGCGYIDLSGEQITSYEFDQCKPFDQYGLARVKQSGKWSFIDRSGKIVSSEGYDKASPIKSGIRRVRKGKFWAFLDKKLNQVTPFHFSKAKNFKHGIAKVTRGEKSALIDTEGNVLKKTSSMYTLPKVYPNGLWKFQEDGKVGLKNNHGEVVLSAEFDSISQVNTSSGFEDNSFSQIFILNKNGKKGYANATGTVVESPKFEEISYRSSKVFNSSKAKAYIPYKEDQRWGTLYPTHTENIFKSDEIKIAGDGTVRGNLMQAKRQGRLVDVKPQVGFVDLRRNSSRIVLPGFEQKDYGRNKIGQFSEAGLALVQHTSSSSKKKIINRKGETVIDSKEFLGLGHPSSKRIPIKTESDWGTKWGFVNPEGDVVIEAEFDRVQSFVGNVSFVYQRVGNSKGWTLINKSGSRVTPLFFNESPPKLSVLGGYVQIGKDGRYGYITQSGQWLYASQWLDQLKEKSVWKQGDLEDVSTIGGFGRE